MWNRQRLGNIKSGNSFHKFSLPYALVQDPLFMILIAHALFLNCSWNIRWDKNLTFQELSQKCSWTCKFLIISSRTFCSTLIIKNLSLCSSYKVVFMNGLLYEQSLTCSYIFPELFLKYYIEQEFNISGTEPELFNSTSVLDLFKHILFQTASSINSF
jgi:hypothetical protein